MVDSTPPSAGIVYDGPEENLHRDVDFFTSTSEYFAHWTDFTDPHTTVTEFFVKIGSCKGCDDLLNEQSVGARTGQNKTYKRRFAKQVPDNYFTLCYSFVIKNILYSNVYSCVDIRVSVYLSVLIDIS